MSDNSLDPFLKACGATDALRLTVNDAQSTTERVFWQPYVIVGCDPRADVQLSEDQFGPRHALLQLIAGRLLFVEFQGQTPSAARRAGWLDPGQTLELGRLKIRLAEGTPASSRSANGAVSPPGASPASMLELTCRTTRNFWRMRKPLVLVGSSSKCKIRLLDPDVSRFHCALVGTRDGLWAVDLLGRGGIAVNGATLRASRLDDGDKLRIGGFTICKRNDSVPSEGRLQPENSVLAPRAHTVLPLPVADSQSAAMPVPWPVADLRLSGLAPSPLVAQLTQLQHQMFAHMQQQMAEQFQQTMQMFVEGLWTMHQEQSRLVRRELKRIRLLTRKLAEIQSEPAKLLAAESSARSTPGNPRPALEGRSGGASDEQETAVAVSLDSAIHSATHTAPQQPRSAAARRLTSIDQSPVDVHAWLNQRVADIQKERQNSWQRIVGLIQGKPSTKTAAPPSEPNQTAG